MDVHPPHESIHSMKDFFLHLFTITIGLLIAVGIEGCVELHREHKLVDEARATLREEIKHNADSMTDAVGGLDKQMGAINNDIKALKRIQKNPKDKDAQDASINAAFSSKSLASTAWKTAQTTGALSYMPYEEAGRLIFHVFAALPEFERNLIRERTVAGLKAARARGHKGGRPAKLSAKEIKTIRGLLKTADMPVAEVAARFGVARSTLYRTILKPVA